MAARQPFVVSVRFLTVLAACLVLSGVLLLNIVTLQPALSQLLDFGSFIAAGREVAAGENPYLADSPLVYTIRSADTGRVLPSPNLNPPVSVLIFRGLSQAEPIKAVSSWRLVSALLFAVGIFTLGWWYQPFTTPLRMLWAICLAGLWNTVALGQIYAPLFLSTVGAWLLMEKGRTLLAGILLGFLIAIKPNFLFWLLLLVVAGHHRTALSALATIVTLSLLPILVLGTSVYGQWLAALIEYPTLGLAIAGNSSLQSLAARLGYEQPGLLLSLILAGTVVLYAYSRGHSLVLHKINSLGILSSILISPFSWVGYTVITLPIFFARPRWSWLEKAAAVCLVFPYALVLYFFRGSAFHSILFGWLYGWGVLLLFVGSIREPGRREAELSLGDSA